jgi:arsenite-transporting ATPase
LIVDSMDFFKDEPTRILLFTGKGGVGKTSLACAVAIRLTDSGRRVLLVSTDPASNLDEVLGTSLSGIPTAVPGADGLFALNIDPEAAARAYRERLIEPYRGILPNAALTSMEEQLSGACTVEIAAFDEFTKLLGNPEATAGFDHIIFDTAPTGHTLRLLKLPAAWTGFIAQNTTGTSCLGPLAGLSQQKALCDASLRALTDSALTTLVLVSRPETSALIEANRSRAELADMGVSNQHLFVNGVFIASDHTDAYALALEKRGRHALESMPAQLAELSRVKLPVLPYPPMGTANLRRFFGSGPANEMQQPDRDGSHPSTGRLSSIVDELENKGRGVVMTMGKGGVGKTTIAAAIAVELAHRGHRVQLSTTDPAAHVASTVAEGVPNLWVSRIDPAEETRLYTNAVFEQSKPHLDAEGLALLEEDLRSPCTEEIAVFSAFARTVAQGDHGLVVLETAPTGHTILLLDAAQAYHRDVARTASNVPEEVRHLLSRLRDPEFTRILLVTLPEATPVHEAGRLQQDLARAGIEPFAWIVNQTLTGIEVRDPVLVERERRERPFLAEVQERWASRMAVVPWQSEPPIGPAQLAKLTQHSLDPIMQSSGA